MTARHVTTGVAGLLLACAPFLASGQSVAARPSAHDSATAAAAVPVATGAREAPTRQMAPGPQFKAGPVHRFFLGSDYRDLWTTPIRVPVLDVNTFAGGLHATKAGGGMQTKSLRLQNPDGIEYSFREVRKDHSWSYPAKYKGSLIEWLSRDQRVMGHPAAALAAAPLLHAAGVLHATPILVVMPEDANLGEFGAEFAGKLGLLEEYPHKPEKGPGFAGATKIIDSEELLKLINADPTQQVDAPALLTARVMDMFLGDWDRHPGQWKWARMKGDSGTVAPWVPIARDRDMAFVTYEGLSGKIGGLVSPVSTRFDATVNAAGLTENAIEMDRRLLGGLSRATWDSVVAEVTRRVTDSVIDAAVLALPVEYRFSEPRLATTLKQRRASLAGAANRFYTLIFAYVNLHASDEADVATIDRVDSRYVDVRLASKKAGEYFFRRYDARETGEIRLYLHGGDDSAMVTGHVAQSIPLRLIGGNGINSLIDSSTVGRSRHWTSIYDVGRVDTVAYGKDTLFNRRPWEHVRGELQPAQRDFGTSIVPIVGYSDPRGLGAVPRLGFTRYRYGFEHRPYDSRLDLQAEYAFESFGWRVGGVYDQRFESSSLHFTAAARMSQLEIIKYYGLGNATIDSGSRSPYFNAQQRQWMFRPAIGLALSTSSDLSLGPIVQYSTTDSTPGRFISATRPYGVGGFGQAGLQLILHHDFRDSTVDSPHRFMYDIVGSAFPAFWDVTTPFARLNATVVTSIPFDLPTQPLLVVRAGGKKVWGTFPYYEAAFLGGDRTTRYMESQRYAGDAALFATSELRLHVVSFKFIPLDMGVVGQAEAGRVYLNGDSPDGWHTAVGGGLWVGLKDSPSVMTFTVTNERGRPGLHIKSGLGF